MKKSALASVSLHALIVLVALFGIPATKPFEIQPVEAIQVNITNITDNTKVKAQTKSDEKPVDKAKPKVSDSTEKAKPVEKVTEKKVVAAKEPAKVEPPPKPEKKVEPPKPVEEKKVEDTPVDPDPLKQMLEAEDAQLKKAEEEKKKDEEKKKKAEAKKLKAEEEKKKQEEADAKADAKKKADAQKKLAAKFDAAQLEEMLNKENDEASAPVEKKDEAGTPEKAEKDVQGSDEAMSATIIDAMRAKLAECWSIPPSVRENKSVVTLQWDMSKDGRVQGQPIVVGGNGDASAQQAAISAVKACEPYDWLPPDGYHLWKQFEWNFEPR